MIILAYILSGLSLFMSLLLLIKVKNPIGWIALFPKMIAGALSPIWAIPGVAGFVIGWAYGARWALPMGIIGTGVMLLYVWRSTRNHTGFEDAFGAGWKDQIPPQQAKHMVKRRWSPWLKMKASPEPVWERDIPFWTIPGTDRQLLCDIWRPADGGISGLAFIYFHGSGWYLFDKDLGTRPFFRHLVAQGHTVMDVAYRLCPEVDIFGMIGDVKRAIAWMKTNATFYNVNPEKIVLGGGSAGGHLALLAAYTPENPDLTPEDIRKADLSVCGVVSYYGPTDLLAAYRHMNFQRLTIGRPSVSTGPDVTLSSKRDYGRLDILLGGHPDEALHTYQLASPVTHIHPGCPPTLLAQGEQDFIASVDSTCALHSKLVQSGVPSINNIYPWTDHAFDLMLPQVHPATQSALYDVDRFLALLLNRD